MGTDNLYINAINPEREGVLGLLLKRMYLAAPHRLLVGRHMNVLVVNAGSSTLKYQVIDTKSHKVSAKGSCERVCFTGGTFTHAANGSKKVTENIEFPTTRSPSRSS